MQQIVRLLIVLTIPALAQAQPGLATWNLTWLMDKVAHTSWVQACADIGWKSEEELKAAGLPFPSSLKKLPYCNVHDGIDFFKRDECARTIGPAIKNRPTNVDSPDGKCRDGPDLADWQSYELKLRTLRETFLNMEKDGVTLVAVQEVFNEDAVRQILPKGWEVKTTASLAGTAEIPQHVGVAWKVSAHTPTDFALFMELSTVGGRPLRPGFQFRMDLVGGPTDFLVVHLKSGCRSIDINNPTNAAQHKECPLLAEQVMLMERWIDDRVGKDFVILGDFNRSLLSELKRFPKPDPKRFGANPIAAISVMAPEWNDDHPSGSLVVVVPHKLKADGSLIAGDIFCARTPGIDHLILSGSLAARIRPMTGALELLPVTHRLGGKRLPSGKKTVPPSDHCARYIRFEG